ETADDPARSAVGPQQDGVGPRRRWTGGGVVGGRVVGEHRGAARGIEQVRRGARDDAARDASGARDLLVALAIAEPDAPGLAVVAAPGRASALQTVTVRPADAVSVDVVAGPAAKDRPIRLPPAAGDGAGRARVPPVVHHAAELRVPVAAGRPTAAAPVAAAAHRAVGRARLQDVLEWRDAQRGAGQRGAHDEVAPRRVPLQQGRRPIDEPLAHWCTAGRRAVSSMYARYATVALATRNGPPAMGCRESTWTREPGGSKAASDATSAPATSTTACIGVARDGRAPEDSPEAPGPE